MAYSEREREFASLKTETTVGILVLVLCPSTTSGYYDVGLHSDVRLQEPVFPVLLLKFSETSQALKTSTCK